MTPCSRVPPVTTAPVGRLSLCKIDVVPEENPPDHLSVLMSMNPMSFEPIDDHDDRRRSVILTPQAGPGLSGGNGSTRECDEATNEQAPCCIKHDVYS
jgi:hypothetical protein